MTNRWILQAAFLLWFLPISLSINYEELEARQSRSNSECEDLLKQLRGPLCLRDRKFFKMPMEVNHPEQMEKRDAAFIIQEMLQNIFLVFNNTFSSTGWNKTIVESFLGKLHNQIVFLNETLKEVPEDESLTTRISLKSYYWQLGRYLKEKRYSSCAWMVTRAAVSRNFLIIRRLTWIFQS
uniref:Interferon beta n=1 Tax=Mesocricetus auratus TaxID=10036 RepID=A0A890C5F6_MESAU|nr:interferon beta 1 [Mesocricetus auratus]